MRLPIVSAHIDPLPSIGRQAPSPAAIVVIVAIVGIEERRADESEPVEAVTVEEGMAANERPAVPARASKPRAERGSHTQSAARWRRGGHPRADEAGATEAPSRQIARRRHRNHPRAYPPNHRCLPPPPKSHRRQSRHAATAEAATAVASATATAATGKHSEASAIIAASVTAVTPLRSLLSIEASSVLRGDLSAARGGSDERNGQAPSTYKRARY